LRNFKFFEKFWEFLKILKNFEKFEKFWKFGRFWKFWEILRGNEKKIIIWEINKNRKSNIENRKSNIPAKDITGNIDFFPWFFEENYSIFPACRFCFDLKSVVSFDFQRVKWHIPWDGITQLWYMHENLKKFELLTAKFAIEYDVFDENRATLMANLAVKSSNFFKFSCIYHNGVMSSQGICHFTRWKSMVYDIFRAKLVERIRKINEKNRYFPRYLSREYSIFDFFFLKISQNFQNLSNFSNFLESLKFSKISQIFQNFSNFSKNLKFFKFFKFFKKI
jgi:hypothetical protein